MMRHISELDDCPRCGAHWKYGPAGEFSRLIGISSHGRGGAVGWQCPFCHHWWPRAAQVDVNG